MKIRVYYEDTDAAGIVYYANYLKFCERARSELFFSVGYSPQSEDGYFVVKHLEASYFKPASLGDLLEVETRLIERRSASVRLRQKILKDEEKVFETVITLAFLKEGRPVRIPPSIYSLISEWEIEDEPGSSKASEGVSSSSIG